MLLTNAEPIIEKLRVEVVFYGTMTVFFGQFGGKLTVDVSEVKSIALFHQKPDAPKMTPDTVTVGNRRLMIITARHK